MANSVFNILITTQDSAQAVKDKLILSRQSPTTLLEAIAQYFHRMSGGITAAKVQVSTTVVQASGTITFSSFVQDDTITVNGTLLTGKDSPSGSAQFQTGAGTTDTTIAAAAAACINANSTLNKQVVATSASNVLTVTALVPGAFGNLGTIAISAHGSVSGGGLLASGAQDAVTTISHGI
jgi:phage tail sheath gpL-like